jgi:hypothetical protein
MLRVSVHNAARAAGASGLVMLCHSESLWREADSVTRRISSSSSFCTALRVGLILAPGLQGLGESPRYERRAVEQPAAASTTHPVPGPSRWRLRLGLGVGSVPSSGAGEQHHSGDFKLVPAVGAHRRGPSTRNVLRLVVGSHRTRTRDALFDVQHRIVTRILHPHDVLAVDIHFILAASVANRRCHHTIAMTTSGKYTPGRATTSSPLEVVDDYQWSSPLSLRATAA